MIEPKIAAIHYPRGFDIDRLLLTICNRLTPHYRLGGLIQEIEGSQGGTCATSVRVFDLRTREEFNIWEDRGTCSSGCRMNERVLTEAGSVLDAAINDRVDLLIINRYGRAESEGRGLLSSFSRAAIIGIPVLTAVRPPYDQEWSRYHGGSAVDLPCEDLIICKWAAQAIEVTHREGHAARADSGCLSELFEART